LDKARAIGGPRDGPPMVRRPAAFAPRLVNTQRILPLDLLCL